MNDLEFALFNCNEVILKRETANTFILKCIDDDKNEQPAFYRNHAVYVDIFNITAQVSQSLMRRLSDSHFFRAGSRADAGEALRAAVYWNMTVKETLPESAFQRGA